MQVNSTDALQGSGDVMPIENTRSKNAVTTALNHLIKKAVAVISNPVQAQRVTCAAFVTEPDSSQPDLSHILTAVQMESNCFT
jgi:hypothetical protein